MTLVRSWWGTARTNERTNTWSQVAAERGTLVHTQSRTPTCANHGTSREASHPAQLAIIADRPRQRPRTQQHGCRAAPSAPRGAGGGEGRGRHLPALPHSWEAAASAHRRSRGSSGHGVGENAPKRIRRPNLRLPRFGGGDGTGQIRGAQRASCVDGVHTVRDHAPKGHRRRVVGRHPGSSARAPS